MTFPRIKEELNDLESINSRDNLTEKGKELLKEYKLALSICEVNRSLPSDKEIILELAERFEKIIKENPNIIPDLSLEAYKLGFKKSQTPSDNG